MTRFFAYSGQRSDHRGRREVTGGRDASVRGVSPQEHVRLCQVRHREGQGSGEQRSCSTYSPIATGKPTISIAGDI